ncbi:MAG: Hemerythrin cation binding domain protein [Pseudonocardia sp.]|jgi:hemerythrin-like domain-containing protein|nr:Hemerythrin cation binding domain protein [Pseudonocardia sp.]
MSTTQRDTDLDLSGFLAAHRSMRVEYGRLADVTTTPRDAAHEALIDDQTAVFLDLLHQHHQGEDELLWPRLRERVPERVADLDLLEEEHHKIDPLLQAAGDKSHSRESRAAALAELHALINQHLDDEERIALPLICEYITPQEWEDVGKQAVAKMSPKQRKIAFGHSAVLADPAELAELMSQLPPPVRLILKYRYMPFNRRRNQALYGGGAG